MQDIFETYDINKENILLHEKTFQKSYIEYEAKPECLEFQLYQFYCGNDLKILKDLQGKDKYTTFCSLIVSRLRRIKSLIETLKDGVYKTNLINEFYCRNFELRLYYHINWMKSIAIKDHTMHLCHQLIDEVNKLYQEQLISKFEYFKIFESLAYAIYNYIDAVNAKSDLIEKIKNEDFDGDEIKQDIIDYYTNVIKKPPAVTNEWKRIIQHVVDASAHTTPLNAFMQNRIEFVKSLSVTKLRPYWCYSLHVNFVYLFNKFCKGE